MYTTIEYNAEIDYKHHKDQAAVYPDNLFHDIVGIMDDPVLLIDPDTGGLLYANQNALQIYGLSFEDTPLIAFDSLSSGIPPYTPEEIQVKLAKATGGDIQVFEWMLKNRDGELFYANIRLQSIALRDMRLVAAFIKDITKEKRLEEQLAFLSLVVENTTEGIIISGIDGQIKMVNPAAKEITGYTEHELLNQNILTLCTPNQKPATYKMIEKSLHRKGRWRGEIMNQRKNGSQYTALLSITTIKDSNDQKTHLISVFHDITEIKRSQERIQHQAQHDTLTGLLNRSFFSCHLTHTLIQANLHKNKVSVLFIDLDNFKRINDSLGHDIGDQLLQIVAKRLTACVREEDTVARFGGDEFTIILNQVDKEDRVNKVAQRILDALSEPITIKENKLQIGASIGITFYPADGKDPATLIRNADMAMYRAKDMGRNNYQFYTPSMNELVIKKMNTESQIRQGLDRDEFLVYYQPKVDIKTEIVESVEALVRWKKPHVGIISPNDFIPCAEESGLIVPLGYKVLHDACLQTKEWQKNGYANISISVNISAKQFQQNNLVQTISQILEETGYPPEKLELEITESVMMQDIKSAIVTLRELSEMGIILSVDDFGTGYSSLHYIKHFPVSVLKIDKSFIKDITVDTKSANLVNSIISLAHSLNLKVIAEGVENTGQLHLLRDLDCDIAQGYLYCRPLPKEHIDHYLLEKTQYRGL